jgi:hypothetical protein
MKYAFLIYSSTLAPDNKNSYEFGFAHKFFRIVGDRPFGRGDIVEVLSHEQRTSEEFRIDVRVLGDPRVSGRHFDEEKRIELPTLLFLSTRIYLSPSSDYQIIDSYNCEILSFQSVRQDANRVYAVAALVSGIDTRVVCQEPTSKVKFEWHIQSRNDLTKVA